MNKYTIMNSIYIVKPYSVGSKSAKVKSLALVIPAALREKAGIVASSNLMLQMDEKTSQIILRNLDDMLEKYKKSMPAANGRISSVQQGSASK
jgi:antitoxin component of MazEF toxin-antitoxin module